MKIIKNQVNIREKEKKNNTVVKRFVKSASGVCLTWTHYEVVMKVKKKK